MVFVVNKNSRAAEWISAFEHLGDTVLLRANLGHDFGAYQAGIEFLKSEDLLRNCQQLVFLNDSTIFTQKSENLLFKFFENSYPWQSLTFSTQPVLHAQSYFLSFLPEVFNSSAFSNFWVNYYPTSLRHRVIRTGEIGLSEALISAGWLPHSPSLDLAVGMCRLPLKEMKLEEKIALFFATGAPKNLTPTGAPKNLTHISDEILLNRFSHELYESNPTRTLGLYLARTSGFPLKCDSLIGRLYSLSDVADCLRDCGVHEAEIRTLSTLFLSMLARKDGMLTSLWSSIGLSR